jgi:hypothetical protein
MRFGIASVIANVWIASSMESHGAKVAFAIFWTAFSAVLLLREDRS